MSRAFIFHLKAFNSILLEESSNPKSPFPLNRIKISPKHYKLKEDLLEVFSM